MQLFLLSLSVCDDRQGLCVGNSHLRFIHVDWGLGRLFCNVNNEPTGFADAEQQMVSGQHSVDFLLI